MHESNKKKEIYQLENTLPILSSEIIKNILQTVWNIDILILGLEGLLKVLLIVS